MSSKRNNSPFLLPQNFVNSIGGLLEIMTKIEIIRCATSTFAVKNSYLDLMTIFDDYSVCKIQSVFLFIWSTVQKKHLLAYEEES